MKLFDLKNIVNDKYILDINKNPIVTGDIIAVCRKNQVVVETVRRVFPEIGKFESISEHTYIGKNCLNLSKICHK